MAIRKEWTEWHLTPRGWERGSSRKHGRGNEWTAEPEDRAASWVYTETETGAGLRRGLELTWDNKNPVAVKALLQQFGSCPEKL